MSDRFNWIKTRTIRQQECEGPRGVVRSEFEVDVDRSTYRYRLSVEALSVGIFIGNPACGGIHNIAGVCSHQRGRHKYAHIYLSKKFSNFVSPTWKLNNWYYHLCVCPIKVKAFFSSIRNKAIRGKLMKKKVHQYLALFQKRSDSYYFYLIKVR